jgi:hypothetical protein
MNPKSSVSTSSAANSPTTTAKRNNMPAREILSIIAGLIMLYSFVPYAKDILAGKVKPARSTRLMMVLLILVSLLQQHTLGSGWLLAITIGDGIGAVAILLLAIKHGLGGLRHLDMICYALLLIDVIVWVSTRNALLALYFSIVADVIAMTPVFIKTWRQPWTETPMFFALGVIAPLLNIVGAGHYVYAVILFPSYIALTNLLEVGLIVYRQQKVPPIHAAHLSREPLS